MSNESDLRSEVANEVFHRIPPPDVLTKMPQAELAILLASCEKGSAQFLVVEREWARRNTLPKSIWEHPFTKWLLPIFGSIILLVIGWFMKG